LLTISSKSHYINSFPLSVRRVLLIVENRFIASAFFLKLHLPLCDSLCEVILKNRFCQTAIADPIKNRGPYFDIFADSIAVINSPVVWPTYGACVKFGALDNLKWRTASL